MRDDNFSRTLLEAVRVLHNRGYESLRAQPTVYATGHWRCSLGVVGTPFDGENILFRYTSGQEWDYFSDGRIAWTPETLADALETRVQSAKQACTPYRVWHSAALDFLAPDGLYWLIDEYANWQKDGYVQISWNAAPDATFRGFPIPPVF